jgi:putative membrane protein
MADTGSNAPLTPEEVARVDAAIAVSEQGTSGEILAVVARRSSIYWHAPYVAGLWGAGIAIALATAVFLIGWGEWHWHVGIYVAVTVAGFLAGFFLARIDAIERLFADEPIMKAEAEERAARLFMDHAVFGTTGRTGVLLYVSLFEHMVIVLGDSQVSSKLGPIEYQSIVAAVIARLKEGKLEEGLLEGIRMLGTYLAQHFPAAADDVNELPDKLYVIA